MTTKKDTAMELLMIARRIDDRFAGDDEADFWVQWLLSIVYGLDSMISHGRGGEIYLRLLVGGRVAVRTKLRRLIDHPNTPQPEREAALAVLERLP